MVGAVAVAERERIGLLDDWSRRSVASEIILSFVRGFEDRADMLCASSCAMEARKSLGVHFIVEHLSYQVKLIPYSVIKAREWEGY